MQSKQFPVAVGLALLLVVPVDLLVGSAVEEVGQERVREGVLQVKDAAGPAAPRRVVYGHRPPLQIVLRGQETRDDVTDLKRDTSKRGAVMWHLVVLVAAVLRHLVGLKHLFGKTFLTLLLLVQCVGVKACAEFVVPNGAQSGDINLNGGV